MLSIFPFRRGFAPPYRLMHGTCLEVAGYEEQDGCKSQNRGFSVGICGPQQGFIALVGVTGLMHRDQKPINLRYSFCMLDTENRM